MPYYLYMRKRAETRSKVKEAGERWGDRVMQNLKEIERGQMSEKRE